MRRPARRAPALALIALAATPTAQALSGLAPVAQQLEGPREDRVEWQLHGLGAPSDADASGFGLTQGLLQRGAISLDDAVNGLARAAARLPFLNLRTLPGSQTFALERAAGTESRSYGVFFGDTRICGLTVRAHRLAAGSLSLLGALPGATHAEPVAAADWPDVDASFTRAVESMASRGDNVEGARLLNAERCYQGTGGSLTPAWRMVVQTPGGLLWNAYASPDVTYSVQERFFTVTGKANTFAQNENDAARVDIDLPDLKGDGTLTGTLFRVEVPTGFEKATAADHVFNYEPTDKKFVQPALYAHVQRQLDFMRSLGYEWPAGRTLSVRPHMDDDPNVGPNNAFFQPSDETTGDLGQIKLGDGDGEDLKSLAIDADVVAHEFDHQIVYTTLKTAARCFETLSLHEGLADFFAFARTGDACLGETICPPGTGACVTPTCLRTADNTMVFGDAQWKQYSNDDRCYTHKNGQLFSGLLWDLRKTGAVEPTDLAKMVFRAVLFFKEDSGFRDFLLALFLADRELFAGKYRAPLRAAMSARGLDSFVSDVEAAGATIPDLTGGAAAKSKSTGGNTPTATNRASKKSETSKKSACGTIAVTDAGKTESLALLAMILGAPLLLAAGRIGRQRVRVPVRTKRRD